MCMVKITAFNESHLKNAGIAYQSNLSNMTGVSGCTISHMFDEEWCKAHHFKSELVNKVCSVLGINPIDILIAKKGGNASKRKSHQKKSCEPNVILKQIRESKGIKSKELEDMAGVRHGLVGDIENGRDVVSDTQLEKLARALETTVDTLKGLIPVQTELKLVDDVSTDVYTTASLFDILKEEVIKAHEEFKKATKSEDQERYAHIVRMGIHELYRMLEDDK